MVLSFRPVEVGFGRVEWQAREGETVFAPQDDIDLPRPAEGRSVEAECFMLPGYPSNQLKLVAVTRVLSCVV